MNHDGRYKELLKHVEIMKESIMYAINELRQNEQAVTRTTVYPMARVKPLMINGYPVFQFAYEGLIPTYKEDDLEYLSMIRNYYFRATLDCYDYSKFEKPVMNNVMLIFVQYFENTIIRDLENRNKKYIQDAIRHTGLFGDDCWENVWNLDIGLLDEEKNHVQVYVVERKNFLSFYDYLMKNHEQMKKNINFLPSVFEYEDYILKEQEKERQNKIIENNPKSEKVNTNEFYY